MKYYSEKLDQLFNTLEELTDAESKSKKKKSSKQEEPQVTSPTRKELAAEIDAAETAVKEAYANYEATKAKAEELSKKYLEEIDNLMIPAKKAITDAEKKRYEAIKAFNNTFGAYQVTYTGARAADEMLKALNSLQNRAYKVFIHCGRILFFFAVL